MQSEVSEISPTMVEVKVQVPWDDVRKELDANYAKLAKHAKVKGFRQGKVPRHVVKKLFASQVKAEVTGELVEKGLMQACQKHEIQIVAQPEVATPQIADGQALEFTARIEVRPSITSVDLERLSVRHQTPTIEDEAVDAELEQVRRQASDLKEPEPMRGAQKGDVLTVDYAVRIDDELKPDMGAEGRDVELGEDGLIEQFEDGLIGAVPGDSKSISVPFPDDHPNPDLAGKTAEFEVRVKSLRERLLPDLDDELAQDVGEFETLDELRADLRERLEEQVRGQSERLLREKLIDKLLETNPVEVPPSLVQQAQQSMLYEMISFARMTGQQLDPSMLGDVDARATRRVKAGLVLGAVARLNDIDVTDAEIETKLAEIAETTGKHIAKVKVEYGGEKRDQLENQLLEEKIVTFLKSKATIDESPEEDTSEGDTNAESTGKPSEPSEESP